MDALIDGNGNVVLTGATDRYIYTLSSLATKVLSSTILQTAVNGGDATSSYNNGSRFSFNFKLRNKAGDAYKLSGNEVQFTSIVLHNKDGSGINISFGYTVNNLTGFASLGKFLYDYSSATFSGVINSQSALCKLIYPIQDDSFNIIDTDENLQELFKKLSTATSTSSPLYFTANWLLYGVAGLNSGLIATKTEKVSDMVRL